MDTMTPEHISQPTDNGVQDTAAPAAPCVMASVPIADNPNRVLSQAEIDALIASLS